MIIVKDIYEGRVEKLIAVIVWKASLLACSGFWN